MAAKKGGKIKKGGIRFELSYGGLLSLSVVSFCIFLWMFLLGIWAGQAVLHDRVFAKDGNAGNKAAKLWSATRSKADRALAELPRWPSLDGSGTLDREAEPEFGELSFFGLQVGTFEDRKKAVAAVGAWRARGEDAFLAEPAGKETKYRVFTGRYDTLERANQQAESFEQKHELRGYITLLQESEVVDP